MSIEEFRFFLDTLHCCVLIFSSVNRDYLVDVRVYSFVNGLFDICYMCRKASFDASISRTFSLILEFNLVNDGKRLN